MRCGGSYLRELTDKAFGVGARTDAGLVDHMLEPPEGIDTEQQRSLGLCQLMTTLEEELRHVETMQASQTHGNEVIERIQTFPGIGPVSSEVLYATIGEVDRFPKARKLAIYAGLVPTGRHSGNPDRHADIAGSARGRIRTLSRNTRSPQDCDHGPGRRHASHRAPCLARHHGLRPSRVRPIAA